MRKPGYSILLLVVIAVVFSCKKADVAGISNLNRNEVSAIGHGGMGIASTYQMDTYESLMAAIAAGADGVEIDLQMSSDSVLVAFHDNDMNSSTSCTGKINEHTWELLQDCEYVKAILGGYQLLSLPDLVEAWNNGEARTIVFDCKLIYSDNNNDFLTTYANQLIKLVESINFSSNILIESQNVEFLKLIQGLKPDYKLFIYPQTFEEGLAVAQANGLYGITIASSNVSKAQIQEAHDHSLRVAIWNVDSRSDNVAAINKSPDYIQTDKLKGLLRLLK